MLCTMAALSGGSMSAEELERGFRDALKAESDLRWAYLFGSVARGGSFRDVDVAVMLDATARGAVAFGGVVSRLQLVAGDCVIDVTDLRSAAPAIAGRIAREGRVLVDNVPSERKAWEIEANRRALDIEPWLRRQQELRHKMLRRRAS